MPCRRAGSRKSVRVSVRGSGKRCNGNAVRKEPRRINGLQTVSASVAQKQSAMMIRGAEAT
jgi:hypothetical protein